MIRVRFAPSPTGFLHIGGARTALFNWMYARVQKGQFILRIEDTDQVRSEKKFLDEILESMKWLGLDWDELYHQSERFDIYREHANKLLEEDKAYKDGDAIILKMPQKEIKLYDIIRGEITFDTATLKDQVLMKSDGSPTYSLACVVDDALMNITTVIRGEDHIPNTPKQMIIYEALGFKIPKYAHLPLIMGPDGARMSKRTGAVAVTDYKNMGFLPEAMVNYLMLLGWSPGENQEVVKLDAAVKKFSIKKVNKTSAMFAMDKLKWVNTEYIKQMDLRALTDALIPFLKEKKYIDDQHDRSKLENIVKLFKGRLSTLTDFLEWADFFFVNELTISEEDRSKHLTADKVKKFKLLAERLSQSDPYDKSIAETVFKELVEEKGMKVSDLVHPVRVALTGHAIGPSLFEIMAVLGKEKTIERLNKSF